jgi:superfamily II helicase
MKTMVNNSSASVREQTPHLSAAIKQRAQSLINNKSVDGTSRAIIRYGLEINDAWLPELVRRVDAGETINEDTIVTLADQERSSEEKIERLTGLICRVNDEPATKSAALLVLMATIENSMHPKALAITAKHLAFNRRGELNLYDTVDAQVAALEDELFADDTFV